LDVIVSKTSSVFQLLSSKDKSLLIGWDTFLVLNLGLDRLDRVVRLNLKGDGLSGQSSDKDLHTSSETKNQMKCGFLLDVVISKASSILKLLTSKDESLLIGWDTLLVLDLGLNRLNRVVRLDL
jgi:hypothetical protein